jgi:hypothetical protein
MRGRVKAALIESYLSPNAYAKYALTKKLPTFYGWQL